MQSFNISWVKPDCFKTFRGISPPVTLLIVIFKITSSISLTITDLKENFSLRNIFS